MREPRVVCPPSVMKILLQDQSTYRYVAENDRWSDCPDQARRFADLAEARRYGNTRQDSSLRIVALTGRTPGLADSQRRDSEPL